MRRLIYHISKLALGMILVALAVANAAAQIVVEQCDTMEFSVTSRPSIDESHFVWGIYNSSDDPVDVIDPTTTLDPALYFVDGQYAGRTVKVTGLDPGKYYVRINVWDEITCTDNVEMYVLEVLESTIEMELFGDTVCVGEIPEVKIIFTGRGPFNIKYSVDDGTTVVNINGWVPNEYTAKITDPLPPGRLTFWVMEVSDGCIFNTYEVDDETGTADVEIVPDPTNSRIYLRE